MAFCKICGGVAELFDVVDFNKICSLEHPYRDGLSGTAVYYHRCELCGFIFTQHFDEWTADDFSREIYNADYHTVDGEYASIRPKRIAGALAEFLSQDRNKRILDYGSGSGSLESELRGSGFDVTSYDPFSKPHRPSGTFDLVTCFEVLEHSPTPTKTLDDMLSFCKEDSAILFQTSIQPIDINSQRCAWWYIAPRNGHTSIYSEDALRALATTRGLSLFKLPYFWAFSRVVPFPKAMLSACYTCEPTPANKDSFNGVEVTREGRRFQWTAASRVDFTPSVPLAGKRLTIRIPYIAEIETDFAARSKIIVGGDVKSASVSRAHKRSASLQATFEIQDPSATIFLVTPEPRRPCDLKPSNDTRRLGLAIPLP